MGAVDVVVIVGEVLDITCLDVIWTVCVGFGFGMKGCR